MFRTYAQGWFIAVPPRAKINQSSSWTNAEVKSGKGREKVFSQQILGAVKGKDLVLGKWFP